MPELPEVETTRRGIADHVIGQSVASVVIRERALRWPVPQDLPARICGRTIHNVRRRAKYLLLDVDNGSVLIHLGMSGSLRLVALAEPARKHDHLDIVLCDGKALRLHDPRRFGAVLWTPSDTGHPLLRDLGPEPWDATGEYLFSRSRNRRQSIKSFVMDSRIIVGIGNIYASEALFDAGIRPRRAAGRLARAQFQRLQASLVAVIERALAFGGTTLRDFVSASGDPGYFRQELKVYERANEPCRTCRTPIRRIIISGRSTYYCPLCQH